MKTTSVAIGLTALLLSQTATAQVCEQNDVQSALQYLRRLSLDLRGRLPDAAELESVVTNGAVDPTIVQSIVSSDEAIAQLRAHYRDILWTNLADVRLSNQSWNLIFGRANNGAPTTDAYFMGGNARANAYRGGAPGGCFDEPARFDAGGNILTRPDPGGTNWRREGWVMVEPYWAPGTQVKVCAFDAQTAAQAPSGTRTVNCMTGIAPGCGCGPNLNWCQSTPARTVQTILGSMSEQLLRHIDGVIRDGRPFSDVIAGTDMEINGPISHYLRYQTGNGPNFLFVTTNQNFPIPEMAFTDQTWRRVERGQRHAGILTMPGYLIKFQSNRGRANRFYNAFLCQYFEAPAGGLPAASDECHDEPDLTKRCGCKYCHIAVEPASAHWGRWAEAGLAPLNAGAFPEFREECAAPNANNNASCRRFYLTRPGHADEEQYRGYLLSYVFADAQREANIAAGPMAIAQSAVDSGAFASCAVKKIYERLLARESGESDAETLAELTQSFRNGYDYRSLVEQIVTRPEYLEAGRFDGRED